MYQDLKKLFHMNEEEARSALRARRAEDTASFLTIGDREFFYWLPPDVLSRLLEAERLDRRVDECAASIPSVATNRFLAECLIDEIILTNDIEGVISTRKEVELALEALKKHDKRRRFQGIVSKYAALATAETVPLQTCDDVRALYDDLVLEEVVAEDPEKAPDGKLFRTESVRVVDAAQRVIHENVMSEPEIVSELAKALELYNDATVEPLVRAALFHFIFAYIHPFYDGNGRTNRFISSALVCSSFSRWAGLRLSFSVKESVRDYYQAFRLAEHPLSHGDLTPFVITFLDIVVDALRKTHGALSEKKSLLEESRAKLKQRFDGDTDVDVEGLGTVLLSAALFTARGLAIDDLAEDAGVSVPTAYKLMDGFKREGLLERQRYGRHVYYRLDLDSL